MRRSSLYRALPLLLALSATACLKTRAQLKEDGGGQEQPAHIQPVEPKGSYAIDEMKGEITRLAGRIEDLERAKAHDQSQATAAQNDHIKKLETRMVELEQAQAAMIEQLKKAQASAPPPDPSVFLEKGKALLEKGDLDGAIDNLGSYLKSPGVKQAEEATFLRAEALFDLKHYKRAIADYAQFPEKFPKSKRMPQALYKIGLSFLAINSKDDARAFFQELVEKYPKAPEAKKARAKLK